MAIKNTDDNEIIYLKIHMEDGFTYECVGVMMEDAQEYIKIAFNAHNDLVKDYISVQKKNILELKVIDKVQEYK